MRLWFGNLKLRMQVSLTFCIVFLLLLFGSGTAFYSLSARNTTENYRQSAENAMAQIGNTLDTRLLSIDARARQMLTNTSFLTTLEQRMVKPNAENTIRAQGIISDALKEFEGSDALISSSFIYAANYSFESFYKIRKHDFVFTESPYYTVYADDSMKSEQWLPAMEDQIFQGRRMVVPCVRRFTLMQHSSRWQYFVYQLDLKVLENLLMGERPFFEDIIIIDANGNRISGTMPFQDSSLLALWKQEASVQAETGEETDGLAESAEGELEALSERAGHIAGQKRHMGTDVQMDGSKYLVESCFIPTNGWCVFGIKSQEELLNNLRMLRKNIYRISSVLFALSLLVIYIVAGRITDALSRLERQMSLVEKGHLETRFFYPYKNEIGSLSQSFNYMLEQLQSLVKRLEENILELRRERDRVEQVQRQKRKAELQALQAQINPHFLYNTLNTIAWQAADQGMDDVSLMACSLGRFFQIGLSKGNEIITFADETEYVSSYLSIQQIRYQDKLRYALDVPAELLSCRVLKLILQPLVENAIYHGIKEKKNGGQIRVSVHEEQQEAGAVVLILSVWDDGAGIPADKLAYMNRNLANGTGMGTGGYGIYNVNERIKLYYGKEYGLSYRSEEGTFTEAVICIPKRITEGKAYPKQEERELRG